MENEQQRFWNFFSSCLFYLSCGLWKQCTSAICGEPEERMKERQNIAKILPFRERKRFSTLFRGYILTIAVEIANELTDFLFLINLFCLGAKRAHRTSLFSWSLVLAGRLFSYAYIVYNYIDIRFNCKRLFCFFFMLIGLIEPNTGHYFLSQEMRGKEESETGTGDRVRPALYSGMISDKKKVRSSSSRSSHNFGEK